jgi:peptidoglycan hydrolase-like protein with peptidoglycan-binding domain
LDVKTISICVLSLSAALIVFAGDNPSATTKAASTKTSTQAPADPGKKTPVSTSAASKNGSSKVAASSIPSKKAVSKRASKPAAAVSRHSAQQQPTPERYKEIQQALAGKGYFKGAPDGNWGTDSVDALKRFQHDQNLPEDGKIGSLSLIALGLGPKHDAAAEVPSAVGSATPAGVDKNTPQ